MILLLFTGCLNYSSDRGNPTKTKKTLPLSKAQILSHECGLPTYFWSSVTKVDSSSPFHFFLLHFKEAPDAPLKSAILNCNSGIAVAHGDEKSQIIDFVSIKNDSLAILRSVDSGIPDPWIDKPLRELVIEFTDPQSQMITFFDHKQSAAVRYDDQGNERASEPMATNRTLFFASYSGIRFGKLYKTNSWLALSYVGTGGYRIAVFDTLNLNTPRIFELMPNTEANWIIFDREAAPLAFHRDDVYSALQFSKSDVHAFKKRFGIDVPVLSTSDDHVLVTRLTLSSQSRLPKLFAGELSAFPEDLGIENDLGYLLVNEIGSNQRKVTIELFDSKSLDSKKKISSPSPEMSSARTLKVCNGRVWVGGNAGFQQVATGSVVNPGDAFLWSTDLYLTPVDLKIFGTTRDDDVTAIDCSQNGILIGGNENGPITHTGDSDSSQLYQASFVGIYLQ